MVSDLLTSAITALSVSRRQQPPIHLHQHCGSAVGIHRVRSHLPRLPVVLQLGVLPGLLLREAVQPAMRNSAREPDDLLRPVPKPLRCPNELEVLSEVSCQVTFSGAARWSKRSRERSMQGLFLSLVLKKHISLVYTQRLPLIESTRGHHVFLGYDSIRVWYLAQQPQGAHSCMSMVCGSSDVWEGGIIHYYCV